MNAEYQRLEAEASDVENQMRELADTVVLQSAVDVAKFEKQIADLGRKRASLGLGMALIRRVNSLDMKKREEEFVKALAKKFHSQGTRTKVIHLPGDVTVALQITYYHRLKTPKADQQGRRGLYPMLMLLGIAGHYTPGTRNQMAKASVLLGSYEEAAEMLAEQGIDVSVNQLRNVTAGMGRMLQKRTTQGSLTVAGNVSGRRIVVSLDGGRVRLRERRRGKTSSATRN